MGTITLKDHGWMGFFSKFVFCLTFAQVVLCLATSILDLLNGLVAVVYSIINSFRSMARIIKIRWELCMDVQHY